MKTTREQFGVVLASLARLYRAAEQRGDTALAARYAAAVDLLLGACPPDPEQSASRESALQEWPAYEQTLVGLGIVARHAELTAGESASGVRPS